MDFTFHLLVCIPFGSLKESYLHSYTSLSLLRSFYSEGMVDNRTFLAWLVQQTGTCNLAQLGFVSRLADDYLDGMLMCRALVRPFAEACFNRLAEVCSKEQLPNNQLIVM